MNTIERLQKAREILQRDGWRRNTLGCNGGGKCLLGALWATERSLDIDTVSEDVGSCYPVEVSLLDKAVGEVFSLDDSPCTSAFIRVYHANDRLCDTEADALHVLDAAIDIAKKSSNDAT